LTEYLLSPSDGLESCAKIVEAACGAAKAAAQSPSSTAPNWDSIANALASLSVGLAWGSIMLAVVAIIAGFEWGRKVTEKAEREARKTAEESIAKWLSEEAPPIVRRHAEYILNTSIGSAEDGKAAEDIGSADL
jgi:hypothetical protein